MEDLSNEETASEIASVQGERKAQNFVWLCIHYAFPTSGISINACICAFTNIHRFSNHVFSLK